MAGKYKHGSVDILPSFKKNECFSKIKHYNNSAYVDSFFSFLSSQTLHTHHFSHGIDFYGSFLGIKEHFHYNIADDLEFLHQSKFFHKHKNKLFNIESCIDDLLLNYNTRNYKKRLALGSSIKAVTGVKLNDVLFNEVFSRSDISNNILTNLPQPSTENLVFHMDISHNSASTRGSNCSSRSSHTSSGSQETDDDAQSGAESESSSHSSLTTASDDVIGAVLLNFPVQIICLEALTNTLDSILEELELEHWKSCLFQIIMSLLVYQKLFDFTHNDLHTNNIMFKKTEKMYLYYYYNKKYYKVPTYGRIYKIIDFGRAIYKYKGNIVCSDSFHPKGDAATQYNCEPYFNKKKPRLDPNKSFDLCRLGCSLYDFFDPEGGSDDELPDPICKLVERWCRDDKGRNILYKKNGEERYPEFKLYKMIARTVHHCPPQKEIENTIFNKFITSKKKIKKAKIFNVDTLPSYVN